MMKARPIVSAALLCALLVPSLPGQGGAEAPSKTTKQDEPLTLQQRAYKKFQELRASMRRLQTELTATDADKAKRLKRGLQLMQERRINEEMRDIETLLTQESWDMSLEKMAKVQKDLAQLLGLLMDRDVDLQELMDEIIRLDAYKKRVEKLIKEQAKLKSESRKAEELAKQLERIERAKAAVQKLKEQQGALKSATQKEGTGKKDVEPLEAKQGELSEDAERLERDLEEIEDKAKELEDAAEAGDSEGKGEGEGKPSESKPGESKPGEGKGKPSEGKASSEGGESSGGKASSKAGKAAESMQKSQQKLGLKQPESSLDDQEEALKNLDAVEKALEELENDARAKLLELPFDQLKKEQEKVFGDTFKLSEDMQKDAEGSKEGEGEGEGKPTPGQQNIEQALPKQKNAAGSLKKMKPGKAKQKQQDAQDQLEEARKRLEDALAQLRQEMQEEVLRALEERFTEMLAKQKAISAKTVLTQKWRARIESISKKGKTPTSVKDRCHRLAEEEQNLRQMARDALQLIEAEGSGAVFPEIVQQLADDFELAATLLDGFATGEETQEHQKEIERTLTQLLDALTRRIEQNDARGGAP